MRYANHTLANSPGRSAWAEEQAPSTNCLGIWASSRAWPLAFPILFFVVQGNVQTGTVAEQLRLAAQTDTFWGRWGFILLIAVCFGLVLRRLSSLLPKILAVKDIVAFAFLALVSALWSDLPSRSLFNGAGLLALTLLAVYVVTEFTPSEQMQLLVLPGFLVLLLSFGAVLLKPAIGIDPDENGAWRGIFQQKNVCGLVVLFLVMPFIQLPVTGMFGKAFRVLYVTLAFVLIVMSRAKTAWCIALVYFAILFVLRILRKFAFRDFVFLSLMLGVATTASAIGIYENSASVLAILGKDSTMSQRTIIWSAVWGSIAKHPLLGYGFSAFWRGLSGESLNIILASGWLLAQAQNGFLDLWLQLGLVGILFLALIVLRAGKDAFACFRSGQDESVHWYCAILICALIYNFSESFIADPRHICWFLVIVACAGLRQAARQGRGPVERAAIR